MATAKKVDLHDVILKELRQLSRKVAETDKKISNLAIHVTALDERLTRHMDDEEVETKEISDKLGKIAEANELLINAMPQKDGKPDFHGHRVDHEDQREDKKIRDEKKTWLNKIILDIKEDVIKYVIGGFVLLCIVGVIALITNDKSAGALKFIFEFLK